MASLIGKQTGGRNRKCSRANHREAVHETGNAESRRRGLFQRTGPLNPTDASISVETGERREPAQEVACPLPRGGEQNVMRTSPISLVAMGRVWEVICHMHIPTPAIVFFSLSLSTLALANPFKKSQDELEARISENRFRFEQRQLRQGESIPWRAMNDARGIIIMHQVKAGLGIGAEFGNGIASVKGADGKWGTPGFVSLSKGSYGFQIGANEVVTIMLLMTDESLNLLRGGGSGNVGLNVEAVAGPLDAGTEIDSNTLQKPILVYSDAKGAFIDAALQAGAIVEAKKKNDTVYAASLEQILFSGQVAPTAAGRALITTLESASVEKLYSQ